MASMFESVSIENPLIKSYIFYASILAIKLSAMSILTPLAAHNVIKFPKSEDASNKKAKVNTSDNVERVRRAHLNDLENIPLFLVISFLYILTNPNAILATMLLRMYTGVRIAHTWFYALQRGSHSARGKAWAIGFLITVYMLFCLIISLLDFY